MISYKIAILICYFGKLPANFELWLDSCRRNPLFDFFIYTDCSIGIDLPPNVIVKHATLDGIKSLIEKKFKKKVPRILPYKLCDFKCMYGLIFEEDIRKYHFWGMCDMDMIFGDLSAFINDRILDEYEKIYQLGHLTLYKNETDVNKRFMLPGYVDWNDVIQTPNHCRLCERGMMKKYEMAGIPVYKKRDYADISKVHRRYQLSNWLVQKEGNNYKNQIFYWENGKVFRAYVVNGNVLTEEFNYIHFQKRKILSPDFTPEDTYSYYITKNSFIKKPIGIPTIEDILLLNPYRGKLLELLECIEFEIKKRSKNIKRRFINLLIQKDGR